MKKLKFIFSAMFIGIAGLSVVSCSGTSDEQDTPVITKREYVKIIADKAVIEADGVDKVTFSIIDNNGVDLTKDSYIKNVTTGSAWRKGVNTFTHNENSTVKFTATAYDESSSYKADTIEVVIQNRKKYELYKKRVAVFKVTGTWCVNCPSMTTMIKEYEKTNPDRIIEMSFHASSDTGKDPFHQNSTVSLFNAMSMKGFPSSVFDLYPTTLLTNPASTLFKESVSKEHAAEPAICGIKVKTTYDEQNKTIYVDASVAADKKGEFELAYVLLQDGIVSYQNGGSDNYVHNNIVVGTSENFLGSENKVAIEAGKTHDFERFTMGAGYEAATKTRILVYAIIKKDGINVVNNIVECELGKEINYEENAD